jgi:hypothetical protein
MAEIELQAQCEQDPNISEWLSDIASNNGDVIKEVATLPITDPRRLAALDPQLMRKVISSKKGIHLRVASHFEVVQDMVMIQRCLASTLPVKNGEPISLKGLFKKLVRKTAIVERFPHEELEYQLYHREAAK